MGKALCVLSLSLLAVVSASAQESKPAAPTAEYKIPPEAAKMANPVKPTTASIAQGKKI